MGARWSQSLVEELFSFGEVRDGCALTFKSWMTKKRKKKRKNPLPTTWTLTLVKDSTCTICVKGPHANFMSVCLAFFLSIISFFLKKIFFVTSDFDPACVFVCDDADDVCDGASVWTDLWFVSQPLCTFPSWGRRGFRREKETENVDLWICDAPCERFFTLTVPECLHRASNC